MTQIRGLSEKDPRDPQTYVIIGSAMEVHRTLGRGFLEAVYRSALEWEFGIREVPYAREVEIPIRYKGNLLDVGYRADFVCCGDVLVELKAVHRLTAIEEAQIINYLLASHLNRGILLNFGAESLQFRRFVGTTARLQSVKSVKSVVPMDRAP